MQYVKHRKTAMKRNPQLSERWVQGIVNDDPSLLGFGDVVIKDVERVHDVTLDLQERTPGGLGVMIVRKMMDNVAYTFQNGRNILTMTLESE